MTLLDTVRRLYRRSLPVAWRDRVRWVAVNLGPALASAPGDLLALRHRGLPVPGPVLRSRVARSCSRRAFLEEGALIADSVLQALRDAGAAGPALRRWVDFGCGSGRVARHLIPAVAATEYTGLDVDPPAIRWCRRNLPGRYLAIAPDPPTPLPGACADAVVAVSVFSHLDPESEEAWLGELERLLAPGGVLLVSTHSDRLTWELPHLTPRHLGELAASGRLFVPGSGRFNAASAFHTRADLERRWGQRLRLLHYAEHGLAGYQDVSVWGKRSSDPPDHPSRRRADDEAPGGDHS